MSDTYLENIYLKNFRNLKEVNLDFSKNVNLITGNNANGKTNLLEAIYYSIYKKSFRKSTKDNLIFSNLDKEKYFILKSNFYKNGDEFNHSMKIEEDSKLVYVNNQKNKRFKEVKSISINPYDCHNFYANKKIRRELLDNFISDFDSAYKKSLANFSKALRSRNVLLAKFFGPEDHFQNQIKVYDKIISENVYYLLHKRFEFIEKLNPILCKTFKNIFREPLELKAHYESCFDKNSSKEDIFNFYQSGLSKDRILKTTKRGLHLDDLNLSINNNYCHEYASIGQQKVSFLSILFAYVGYLETTQKITPILLIDDISGELDSLCLDNLLKYLENKQIQVFITTANLEFASRINSIFGSKHYLVEQGLVTELEYESRRSSL